MTRRLSVPLLALALLATGCGGADPEPKAEEPKTFTASGTFVLNEDDVDVFGDLIPNPDQKPYDEFDDEMYATDSTCSGRGGYADLTGGAQVVVRDSSGEQVGLGALSEGTVVLSDDQVYVEGCSFTFSVAEIPEAGNIFSVEVTHRGPVSFRRADAGALALSIG